MVLVAACGRLHTRQGFATSSLMSRHDQRTLVPFDSDLDMARHLTMLTLLTGRHHLLFEDDGEKKTLEMHSHVPTSTHGNGQAQSIGLHN